MGLFFCHIFCEFILLTLLKRWQYNRAFRGFLSWVFYVKKWSNNGNRKSAGPKTESYKAREK
jgi:hypothetical protein